MANIDPYFDAIDTARIRRIKELSEIKRTFNQLSESDPSGIASKAVVVLTYANWEGFYNDGVRSYLDFLREKGGRVRDTDWMLLVGALQDEFQSVRDRNHSFEARRNFISNLKQRLDCGFDAVDITSIEAQSNLNFKRLSQNYDLLSFEVSDIQRLRIRLDKELVEWRHAVAHGDSPDLTRMDIGAHIDFTAQLLILISDHFQRGILARI